MPLTKSTTMKTFIDDFVNSDNPKFAGKSKAKRIEMAQAAYYAKQNEGLEDDISIYSFAELDNYLEEEELDEVSKGLLGRYIKKAASDIDDNAYTAGTTHGKSDKENTKTFNTTDKIVGKRKAGIAKAVDKMVRESIDLDEAIVSTAKHLEGLKAKALEKSKEGVAVHINKDDRGVHSLSDFYDKDRTVASYSHGKLKEDLDEKHSEKEGDHVTDIINNIKTADAPTKEKHLKYLKDVLAQEDYEHIEKLLKSESAEDLEEASLAIQKARYDKEPAKDEKEEARLKQMIKNSTKDTWKIAAKLAKTESVEGLDEDLYAQEYKDVVKNYSDTAKAAKANPTKENIAAHDEALAKYSSMVKAHNNKKTRTESLFDAMVTDKLSEAADLLKEIFAEKVSNKLFELKIGVAKTITVGNVDAPTSKYESNHYIS